MYPDVQQMRRTLKNEFTQCLGKVDYEQSPRIQFSMRVKMQLQLITYHSAAKVGSTN